MNVENYHSALCIVGAQLISANATLLPLTVYILPTHSVASLLFKSVVLHSHWGILELCGDLGCYNEGVPWAIQWKGWGGAAWDSPPGRRPHPSQFSNGCSSLT